MWLPFWSSREGYREGRWIVIDYGDVLMHIFHKHEREFYGLERLWTNGNNFIEMIDDAPNH